MSMLVLSAFRRAPLLAICGLLLGTASLRAQTDPLASWNDCPAKRAIVEFAQATTTEGNPRYVAPDKRIATFDQDGTLWVEQPIYTQVTFAFDRVEALAPRHPEWKTQEPFRSILSGDRDAMQRFTIQDFERVMAETHAGMTVQEFQEMARNWLATAIHPRFKRPYTELVYQPMVEVIRYLRDKGFKTYIVTGGGQEFVRVYAEKVYGIPPEQVVGSAAKVKYETGPDGKPRLAKLPEVLLIDDRGGKPEAINLFIGLRPYAAFGNSTGDQQMLEWTQAGEGARLMMLVHHDDAEREYAYGAQSIVGTFSADLAAEAHKQGWSVISMKNDWKRIFAFDR
ncbi:MAG TPA: HAD family hydrolase [Pirellulales bacterium]|jgi:phosphoglycolate phosphatase-like HAD superfamily hydrolase